MASFLEAVALYKMPALSLFLAAVAALGKLRNDVLLIISSESVLVLSGSRQTFSVAGSLSLNGR